MKQRSEMTKEEIEIEANRLEDFMREQILIELKTGAISLAREKARRHYSFLSWWPTLQEMLLESGKYPEDWGWYRKKANGTS